MKTIKILYACTALMVFGLVQPSLARDWYFDKDSVGGPCSNTGTGTITQPFCNIFNVLWDRSWNGAQAGDTVYIRKGVYGGRLFWIKAGVLNNGTPSAPITIRAYPGETVVFDGTTGTNSDLLIKFSGTTNYTHDIHWVGPFEVRNYTGGLDGDTPTVGYWRTNLLFDNFTIHDGSFGFIFRFVNGVTVRNSTFYNLKGRSVGIDDNVIGVSVRGSAAQHSTNVTIHDCDAFDINDGKGGDNGDGDGFHTDQYVDVLTLKNLVAYRISEDGIDVKAQTVTMENLVSYQNGATGIKMWGGGQGRMSTYTAKRLLSWGNRETGAKCMGWLDSVTATVDNSTFWANGEDAFKNTNGTDNSNDCIVTLRNSILGATRDTDLRFYAPRTGYTGTTNLDHTDIYTTAASSQAISPSGCSPLSGKYTTAQYLAGTYNTDLSGGYVCGGAFGTIFGTSTAPMIASPAMVDPPDPFEWEVISQTSVTGGTVQLVDPVVDNSYPWPNPVVGHFVEINFDGVRRQITGSDAVAHTISFTPALSSTVCGRATDCRGVMVTGWATGATHTNIFYLSSGSPAKNAGLWVSGVHCAKADDAGGALLQDCIHWKGSAPDLGFYEFGILTAPRRARPVTPP